MAATLSMLVVSHWTVGGRRLRMAAVALVLSVTVAGLAGCGRSTASGHNSEPVSPAGSTPASPTETSPEASPPQATPAELPPSEPTHIEVPKINARSSLIPLGLNPDETVEVPPVSRPMQAGWYSHGPTPGEVGAAVVLGHVDGGGKPGIFYRLKNLQAGDEILITRADGGTVRFLVHRVQQVPKTQFPTDDVYGDTVQPELRLITCGGTFDRATGNYTDNIIAYATIAP